MLKISMATVLTWFLLCRSGQMLDPAASQANFSNIRYLFLSINVTNKLLSFRKIYIKNIIKYLLRLYRVVHV